MNNQVLARFEARRVMVATGCWIWTGATSDGGYGGIWSEGKYRSAHRVAYEHWRGPIPPGLEIDHLCRVRSCVNPEHLEAVTGGENRRRSPLVGRYKRGPQHAPKLAIENRGKNQCKTGHPLDGANLYLRPDGDRGCKECRRIAWRRWNAKRKVSK